MNANEVIARLATAELGSEVHPNDDVNMSQSSNDVIPTCVHVSAARSIHDQLLPALRHLAKALQKKSEESSSIVKTGRTHLMDAMPVTLGQELDGWRTQITHGIDRLNDSMKRLCALAQGGTAVGTGINAHPQFGTKVSMLLSEKCGIEFTEAESLFAGLSSQDAAVETSGQLKVLAVSLMKIANDLRWMNSGPLAGLGEIALPALQPGSSIMPGKVNPVMAEMLNMAMYHVIGCDTAVSLAAQAGQLELNVMMPVLAHNLFEMMQVTIGSVQAFTQRCVVDVSANVDKAAGWLEKNAIVVTALNPLIGYSQGAELVKEALSRNATEGTVAREKVDSESLIHVGEDRPLTEDELETALGDMRRLTEGGIQG